MAETPPLDMATAFRGLQREMATRLESTRQVVQHPVMKGDVSENAWLDHFQTYLPKRYTASRACVVDHRGATSDQIDIVIHDRHFSPFVLERDGARFVPAESVYCVIEVKQMLDRDNLLYAGKKAASVRALERTSQVIVHAGGTIASPKPPFAIPGGIVALDSGWAPSFGKTMVSALKELRAGAEIQFGCVLQEGGFEVEYGPADPKLVVSEKHDALIFTFLRLLSRLQKLGSVPAMDIDAYARVLKAHEVN